MERVKQFFVGAWTMVALIFLALVAVVLFFLLSVIPYEIDRMKRNIGIKVKKMIALL